MNRLVLQVSDKIQNNNIKTGRRSGFTIVELLIVIVIIGILAAISIVTYSGIQERATRVRQEIALDQIEKVITMYNINTGTSIYPMLFARSGSNTCLGTIEDYPEEPPISGTRFWEGGCVRMLDKNSGPFVQKDLIDEIEEAAGVKFPSIKGLFPGNSLRGVQATSGTNNGLIYMMKGESCIGDDLPSSPFQGYIHCRRPVE